LDKYEYRLKAEQIEKLVKKKEYETAAKIADTIDWRRVRNLNMLYTVSEVYENTNRYGECMEILDMAYDRAPVGRMLLYRMTDICTKMHNFEEAIALYREFVKVAPHDQSRFILKYQIYRERGSSLEDQIKILNEYKTHEYQEKWAYELASLYDQAGMAEECVRECDELILWFSEGEYVTKALELKMKYRPLTASQQEKYNYQRIGSASSVHEDDFEEPEVQGFDPGKFSTMNLQAELAENLDELFQEDATIDLPALEMDGQSGEEEMEEEETGEDLFENKTIELPALGLNGENEESGEGAEEEEMEDLREDATIELPALELDGESEESAEEEEMEDLREDATIELPALELDGESEESAEEEEMEDLREDATIELPALELDGESEESAEEEEMEDLREDATIELPALELDGENEGSGEEESAEEETMEELREDATIELPILNLAAEAENSVMGSQEEENRKVQTEEIVEEEKQTEDLQEDKTIELPVLDLGGEKTGSAGIDALLGEWEQKKAETEAKLEAAEETEKARREKVKQETAELIKLIEGTSEEIPGDVRQILEEIDGQKKETDESIITEDDLPPDLDTTEEESEEDLSIESLDNAEETSGFGEKSSEHTGTGNMIRELKRSLSSKVSERAVNSGHLTKEQARLFAYFTSVQGMSQQLSVLFKEASGNARTNSSSGNLVITGERGNGKTTLAIDVVKALQKQKQIEGKKLAKISGRKLNTKDIYEVLTRLKGGALIVEKAGGLSDATMMAMSLAMETDTGGLLVILEDSADEIEKLFRRNRNFASKFTHHVDIPIFTNDELVAFGKSYAMEQEYSFDEFGILALYDRIGSRQTNDHLVTVAEVKDIIDEAIEHAEKGSIRHLLEKMTRKSVDEFGNHLIREADFEE